MSPTLPKPVVYSLVLCLTCSLAATSQTILNRNLIQNAGAETGPAVNSIDQARVEIPNWTTSGTMTAAKYDGADLLESNLYGPRDRGSNYFVTSDERGSSTATQTIDLSEAAAEIDAGRVRFQLGAHIGGTHLVGGALRATFLDSSGQALLEAVAGAPKEEDFVTGMGLLLRTATGFLLPNTRSVRLVLELGATGGGFGYASADNLSLTLALEPVIGHNLAVNGDAETDEGEDSQNTWKPISGWNAPPGVMAVQYAGTRFGSGDPLPENRGLNLFAGYDTRTRLAFQTVDVTLAKERIDSGGVGYLLSGYLGGYGSEPDQAKLTLAFLDAGGEELGKAEAGPVTLEDRGGRSGLLRRTGEGAVPAGTRQLRLTLSLVFLGDPAGNLYAYADNIALVLTSGASSVSLDRIANSASGATGAVAPGEMVTLSVSGVTLDSQASMRLDAGGHVGKELGGVKVFFDGTQAPLLYVKSSEIGAVVPFDADGKGSTQVRVEYHGVASNTVAAEVAPSAPGVFTQEGAPAGRGLIYGETWTLNSTDNPAAKGSLATIMWTGGGQTDPAGVDGRIEIRSLPRVALPVSVTIGDQSAEVVYAGAVPFGWAGLLMVQAKVPAAAASGDALPVTVSVGGASSQAGVTMAVR